jgi:hypothetical protein
MQTKTSEKIDLANSTGTAPSSDSGARLPAAARAAGEWLAGQLTRPAAKMPARSRRTQVVLSCAGIFLIAFGVRLLHWQDSYAEIARGEPWMSDLVRQYKDEAQRMRAGNLRLSPDEMGSGDARLLLHPPGYSLLMAGIFSLSDDLNSAVRLVQIAGDGLAAVMVLLIAFELFNAATALIAGGLAALSPHFAFYSLWLSPDTLPVLPILCAVYLIIKTSRRPHDPDRGGRDDRRVVLAARQRAAACPGPRACRGDDHRSRQAAALWAGAGQRHGGGDRAHHDSQLDSVSSLYPRVDCRRRKPGGWHRRL